MQHVVDITKLSQEEAETQNKNSKEAGHLTVTLQSANFDQEFLVLFCEKLTRRKVPEFWEITKGPRLN